MSQKQNKTTKIIAVKFMLFLRYKVKNFKIQYLKKGLGASSLSSRIKQIFYSAYLESEKYMKND